METVVFAGEAKEGFEEGLGLELGVEGVLCVCRGKGGCSGWEMQEQTPSYERSSVFSGCRN